MLHRPGEFPVEAVLSSAEVASLHACAEELPRRAPPVLSPHASRIWSEIEQGFGRALADQLATKAGLWGALWEHLGAIWAGGQVALLAISSSCADARALPWELLARAPNLPVLTTTHAFLVGRLMACDATEAPAAHRMRLVIWAPHPEDRVVQAAVESQVKLAHRLALPVKVLAGHGLAALPPPAVGEVDLVSVVAHGEAEARQVSLLLPSGPVPPQDPAHALGLMLRRALLVVLAVCDADGKVPDLAESLAGRLVYAGAPAVLAPRRPWLALGFDALLEGLLPSLLRGEALAESVRAGIAQVAALSIAHPGVRPWSLSFGLGATRNARASLRPILWQGASPGPDAARLLIAATLRAEGAGHGFVGVEHLLLAQLELEGGGPITARLRPTLWRQRDAVAASLQALVGAGRPEPPVLTPRLQLLGATFVGGWDLDKLWTALAEDPGCPLSGLVAAMGNFAGGSMTGSSTQERGDGRWGIDPPTHLEVQGGPEDGRMIAPHEGETLGRWHAHDGLPDHALYQDTTLHDQRLSRRALRWHGPGDVDVLQKNARRLVGGVVPSAVFGRVRLDEGDVLLLGRTTRLLARRG